jgi:hypothetical protein
MLMAGACGGSPVAPNPPAPVPAPGAVPLNSGPYTLAITFSSTGRLICQDSVCTSFTVCSGTPSATSASFDVVVERSGAKATVRLPDAASSLALDLDLTPALITGAISGSARDAQGVVIAASGLVTGAASLATPQLSGFIQGQLSVPGGSCSNDGHTWSLVPR